jgi:hypothetical protein
MINAASSRVLRGETGEENMFVTIAGDCVHVRLSRRNLRQLQALLDGTAAHTRYLARRDETGGSLIVQVEDDADHYEGRNPGLRAGEAAQLPQEANHP